MGWKSPTSHNDPDTEWTDHAKAYDANDASYAYDAVGAGVYGSFLELNIASMSCDKLKHLSEGTGGVDTIDLDAYYDAAWHNVYEGAFTDNVYQEKDLPSAHDVTAMRIRGHSSGAAGYYCLYEAYFNRVPVDYPISTSPGLTISANIDREVAWNRATSPLLAISTIITRVRNRTIVTSPGLTVNAVISRAVAYARASSSGITASATVAYKWAINRAVSASSTISATVDRAVTYTRSTSPGLTISATVKRICGYARATSANLTVSVKLVYGVFQHQTHQAFTNLRTIVDTASKRTIQAFTNVRRILK